MYEVTTTTMLTDTNIGDLIITSLEGGSGYWLEGFNPISLPPFEKDGIWYGHDVIWAGPFEIEATFQDGDNEVITKIITRPDIEGALQLMADKEPSHFRDFVGDEFDADTADVFMQLLCLGEVIYG